MAWVRFFVFSNLFVAACAVLMVAQTSQLLLQSPADPDLLGFVFFATLCSYSFHWYLSPDSGTGSSRKAWQQDFHFLHGLLFVAGLAGTLCFLPALMKGWPWLVLAAFPTFLYSAPKLPHRYFHLLRKVALGKTIFLAAVWMYVTTLLPLVMSPAKWPAGGYLFVIARFFQLYPICILFDFRDREEDRRLGIRSLITYLDEKGIRNLFVLSIAIFTASTVALLSYGYSQATVYSLLVPGALTAILYPFARRHTGDLLYYLVLDGLIAISPLLTLVIGI